MVGAVVAVVVGVVVVVAVAVGVAVGVGVAVAVGVAVGVAVAVGVGVGVVADKGLEMTLYQSHRAKWVDCERCPLHEGRTNMVFVRGQIPCDILLVGEAPGQSEDVLGKPFVGPAGKLLDEILKQALPGHVEIGEDGSTEHWVPELRHALTNLVCCFPREQKETNNHAPPVEAVRACSERLREFVWICKPRLIVLVGALAKKYISGEAQFYKTKPIGKTKFVTSGGEGLPWIPKGKYLEFVEIVHPAAILRANIAAQGLMIQKAIVTLEDAVSKLDVR